MPKVNREALSALELKEKRLRLQIKLEGIDEAYQVLHNWSQSEEGLSDETLSEVRNLRDSVQELCNELDIRCTKVWDREDTVSKDSTTKDKPKKKEEKKSKAKAK